MTPGQGDVQPQTQADAMQNGNYYDPPTGHRARGLQLHRVRHHGMRRFRLHLHRVTTSGPTCSAGVCGGTGTHQSKTEAFSILKRVPTGVRGPFEGVPPHLYGGALGA